jgi:NADH:ubiquinone oxidoreductase subunit K/NADH:ubiquinone oxidoreductase subunit 6 (subunit J)
VAFVRNLIHAVVLLVISFMAVAGLYITLSADFIAVAQILIYAGAISVLMVFAIVLTPQDERRNGDGFLRLPALALAVLVAATLIFVAVDNGWQIADRPGFEETASLIGESLLDKYVLPFEIASVLLLVAMLGAVDLEHYLIVGAILFAIGVYVALVKRNLVSVLMGIELMFNAVNLTFIAFSRFVESDSPLDGHVFVIFVITVAAAEAPVALGLAVLLYRVRGTISVDEMNTLKW